MSSPPNSGDGSAATGNENADVSPMARTARTASIWSHPALWIAVFAAAVAVGAVAIRARIARPAGRVAALPVVASLPDFALIERSGRRITRADLLGTVWVADFIFTSCRGPCPELTLRMRSLSRSLIASGRDARIVSITVDPELDTPTVLEAYANRHGADRDRWWFLTSPDVGALRQLVLKGFLQPLTPATESGPIIHSTRVVLIDRKGRIRAWHDGLDPGAKPLILRDLDALLAEADAE